MVAFLILFLHVLVSLFKTQAQLEAEIVLLRHQSPWQNGHAERLIGSIHRECLDHIVVFGEANLRRILGSYAGYYNEFRTHLSLGKDSPGHRPIQRFGQLAAQPILGGLHHQYCRM
jgi:transposase InsO family protein